MVNKPIRISHDVRKFLDSKKQHKRESYNDVLERILKRKVKGGVK
jgi:predicted CopG family antitoxin